MLEAAGNLKNGTGERSVYLYQLTVPEKCPLGDVHTAVPAGPGVGGVVIIVPHSQRTMPPLTPRWAI